MLTQNIVSSDALPLEQSVNITLSNPSCMSSWKQADRVFSQQSKRWFRIENGVVVESVIEMAFPPL